MVRFSLRVDFAFKGFFDMESNMMFLKSFVNAVLSPNKQLSEITLIEVNTIEEIPSYEFSILLMEGIDENGCIYNIQMGIVDKERYDKGMLFDWSKFYESQGEKSEEFLRKTIGIYILNFNCFEEENYHNVFHFSEIELHKKYYEGESHFIELEKFNKSEKEIENRLDYWTYFIIFMDKYEGKGLPEIIKNDIEMMAAFYALDMLFFLAPNGDEIYLGRRVLFLDEKRKEIARNRGRKEGQEESQRDILIKLIRYKFGHIPSLISLMIENLNVEELLILGKKVLIDNKEIFKSRTLRELLK
jgi:predicted transposase/invertase (TIGR01784 family)